MFVLLHEFLFSFLAKILSTGVNFVVEIGGEKLHVLERASGFVDARRISGWN